MWVLPHRLLKLGKAPEPKNEAKEVRIGEEFPQWPGQCIHLIFIYIYICFCIFFLLFVRIYIYIYIDIGIYGKLLVELVGSVASVGLLALVVSWLLVVADRTVRLPL